MNKIRSNEAGFGAIEGLLVLIVVILLGAAGYMVYKNHNKAATNNSTASSKTSTSITTKATTPGPYAGWRTYSDSRVSISSVSGFSVKYPADFAADDTNRPRQYQFTSPDYKLNVDGPSPYQTNGAAIDVSFDPLPANQTLEDYVTSQGTYDNGLHATTLYGLSAFFTSSTTNSKDLKRYATWAVKDNVVVTISLRAAYSTSGPQLVDLISDYGLVVKSLTVTYGKETTLY